jgi:hypothetical protein
LVDGLVVIDGGGEWSTVVIRGARMASAGHDVGDLGR